MSVEGGAFGNATKVSDRREILRGACADVRAGHPRVAGSAPRRLRTVNP
jgi:hypothetical protein